MWHQTTKRMYFVLSNGVDIHYLTWQEFTRDWVLRGNFEVVDWFKASCVEVAQSKYKARLKSP